MKSEAGFDTLKGGICFVSWLCSAPSVLKKQKYLEAQHLIGLNCLTLSKFGCHWRLGLFLQTCSLPAERIISFWGWAPYFSPRDGKIGIHKIHSTFTVKYSAHEQEVNCVDCKGGIIVSGSRDRTAKVRWSPPYILLFPPVYREWGGRGWMGP